MARFGGQARPVAQSNSAGRFLPGSPPITPVPEKRVRSEKAETSTSRSNWRRWLLYAGTFGVVTSVIVGSVVYVHYSRLIDEKLEGGPFPNTSMVFAAPRTIYVGDEVDTSEIVSALRKSNYSETKGGRMGWYNLRPDGIEILPGPDSFFDDEGGVLKIVDGRLQSIISLRDHTTRNQYALEPELITNLFDRKREKRRLMAFEDLPPVLVNAVVAVEDKRFFQHAGFDPIRLTKVIYVDIKERRKAEGASTISQQLARNMWLTLDKTWSRKLEELALTLVLETKLSKEKIFEYYANHVDLGRRGSFTIRGFGEAAQAFFGKDVRALSLAESATLAGIIQRPSYMNPIRWPERARQRRNVVLMLMRDNGYISEKEYAQASAEPLVTAKTTNDTSDAPYFVDLVNDTLQDQFQDWDFQAKTYRIYTTLHTDLQRDAAEAMRLGLAEVDKQLERRKIAPPGTVQAALVALDPVTGEVRALVGGRSYAASQLNRAIAKRQPGSVFKPFVFAAAINTGLTEGGQDFTPASTIVDEPTTFYFDGKPYEPGNHHDKYYGTVSLRTALAKSLNIPTVKLAQAVGYRNVANLAKNAGMNLGLRATPSLALGAYEVTPIEVAGAYTVFANKGLFTKPSFLRVIRDESGGKVFESAPTRKQVLDPRANYLMVNMLEEVIRSGTGAGVRARGFGLPAAGKTGTSHDGWFAGFTNKLICVVWVGFDDNRELVLEGANSALPIWTEFMKRAHQHRDYRNAGYFSMPEGIVAVDVDPENGLLASGATPNARREYFIAGTQPLNVSPTGGGETHVASWDDDPAPKQQGKASRRALPPADIPADSSQQPGKPKEKKGFFGRIGEMFKKQN